MTYTPEQKRIWDKSPNGLASIQKYNKSLKARIASQRGRDKVKAEMVAAYGGVCAHCGEPDPIVLVIDHIDNNADHRHFQDGHRLYRRLRREGWPKDKFQLLCHNCNYRKEYFRCRKVFSL